MLGCNFDLISNKQIQERNQEINLNLVETYDNNTINARCVLSYEYNNKIPCLLDVEIEREFTLDSYMGIKDQMIY